MDSYRFAGVTVNMEPRYDVLRERSEKYKTGFTDNPDFTAVLSDEALAKNAKRDLLTPESSEYYWTGCAVSGKLLEFGVLVIHASAVVLDGEAYLFVADSGVGKSTHTALWLEHFGDRAYIINDDKPAVKSEDGTFYVYGTPFSGESEINVNARAPLKAVCLLERGTTNVIRKMTVREAIFPLMNQVVRTKKEGRLDCLVTLLDKLFLNIPVYFMQCDISREAVETAYAAMCRNGAE